MSLRLVSYLSKPLVLCVQQKTQYTSRKTSRAQSCAPVYMKKTITRHPVIALYILCRVSTPEITEIANCVQKGIKYVDVYVVPDDESMISTQTCLDFGFKGSRAQRDVTAWDKAMFSATRLHRHYEFVWFMEDDVLAPSLKALTNLLESYSMRSDLVCGDHSIAMVGVSRRLLNAINAHVEVTCKLGPMDALLMTLMKTKIVPPELSGTIRHDAQWSESDFRNRPLNMYHPVKDCNSIYKRICL